MNIKKNNFSNKKNNTLKSLYEVEYFLRDLKSIKKFINLYKLTKKK
jgi:hypothetical protein